MPWVAFIAIALYVIMMLARAGKIAKNRPGVARAPRKQADNANSNEMSRETRDSRPTSYGDNPTFETVRRNDKSGAGSLSGIHTYRRNALNAKSMRRAMIVSEIISKPVSMRGE